MSVRHSVIACAVAGLTLAACGTDSTAPRNDQGANAPELAKAQPAGALSLALNATYTIEGRTVTVLGDVTVHQFAQQNDNYLSSGDVDLEVTVNGATISVAQPFTTFTSIGAGCGEYATLTVILGHIPLPTAGIALDKLEIVTAQRKDTDAGALICRLVAGFGKDNPLQPRITTLNKILGQYLGTSRLVVGSTADVTSFSASGLQLYATATETGFITVNAANPYVFNRTVMVPVTASATCGSTATLTLTTSATLIPEMPLTIESLGGTTAAAAGTQLGTLFCTLSTQLSTADWTGAAATLTQIAPLL